MGTAARHSPPHLVAGTAAGRPQLIEAYGKLPLSFEANRGQTDSRVKFLSRGGHHVFLFTPTEAVLVLTTSKETPKDVFPRGSRSQEQRDDKAPTVLRTIFAGANPAPRVTGLEELPGKANYFIGGDPAKWRTNVPTYAKVRYHDLYPGIDLIFYGNQHQLEYDFVVNPGADLNRIVLGFQGADRVEVDTHGDLILHTAVGPIHQRKPGIYQEVEGTRRDVDGGYVLRGARKVGFQVAAYDTTRPLVIDPVLLYSTYLGGNGFEDGRAIAVDPAGNAYVTGETTSTNFPTTTGAFQTTRGGGSFTAYVAKINPTGSALVYSTYLGGNGGGGFGDAGLAIAVDASGNAFAAGRTTSPNFPTTAGAFQTSLHSGAGCGNAFVTKLNSTGSGLIYSTYLGGSVEECAFAIAVDAAGNAYLLGFTRSGDFPTTPGAFRTSYAGGFSDCFVTKLNALGTALVYSSYLGGSQTDLPGIGGIAVDAAGNAYVTGGTNSPDFPTTAGAFQTTYRGAAFCAGNAFVTKVNPTGTSLVYSTYLGGSGCDGGGGIAVDASGNAYVVGQTSSPNFPTTAGAFQTTYGGGSSNAFVTKVNPMGTGLVYSTYLGGSGADVGFGIAVDGLGNAYLTGLTASTNFPTTTGAFQTTFGGVRDAFMTKLDPTGAALVYSTYLGGSGDDFAYAIAVDAVGNAYVTGSTNSSNFPTTPGAFQTANQGNYDAFVAKIGNIPFAAFSAKVDITLFSSAFTVNSTFTLGTGGSIAPLTQPVTIQLGTASITIPAGLFTQNKEGRFVFSGVINGVAVDANLTPLGGSSYSLKVDAAGVANLPSSNPVTLVLTIGNNTGSLSVTATIQ